VTRYRLDVCNKTGAITVWMQSDETPCGFVPVIGWSNIDGVREFADMLLDFCRRRHSEAERIRRTSDDIICQAIGDNFSIKE
jgi:hypothetical protein